MQNASAERRPVLSCRVDLPVRFRLLAHAAEEGVPLAHLVERILVDELTRRSAATFDGVGSR